MRILTGQGVTHTLLQSAPDELQEASRDERVQGAPGGTDGGIEPNRQFPDLFLRFVSSVAQFERKTRLVKARAPRPVRFTLSATS